MRLQAVFLHFALILALGGAAFAQEPRIGLSVSQETAPLLAGQMVSGARFAAATSGAALHVVDDECSAEGGISAANELADDGVDVVIGYMCTAALEAALPILSAAGIPVIVTGVRTESVTADRERTGFAVFRLGPRADAEREAVARMVTTRWRDVLFALIDDGTIYGRELTEFVRAAAEESGLTPIFFDTYRPQLDNQIGLVGRLRRAGATHVLAGGERSDLALIARDAAALDYPLVVAGGEALLAADGEVPLAEGVLAIAPVDWRAEADADTLASLERAGIVPEGYVLPTHAALEIAIRALTITSQDGRTAKDVLSSEAFSTVIGEVRFDARGEMDRDLYALYRFNGLQFERAQ